jgi:hypothetical protein
MGTATLLAWMLLETAVTSATPARGPQETRQAVLDAGFLDDKVSLGRVLGRDRSVAAREALLQLLADDHYWNRLAGVEGLLVRAEPETDRVLLERMAQDHMVAAEIQRGLVSRATKHPQVLREAHAAAREPGTRRAILDVLGSCPDAGTAAYLQGIVSRRDHPDREAALRALGEQGGAGARATVLAYLEDRALRPHVLAYLLRHGSAADLPTFLKVLDRREPTANALVSYAAVSRWGDAQTVQRVLTEALASPEDAQVRGAITTLDQARGEPLVAPLCRVVQRGVTQDTRLAAAGLLARLGSRASVPCLVSALKERYQPGGVAPVDVIPAIITVGLSTLFQGLSERWNEDHFQARRQVVLGALRALTGQDHGEHYERWLDWAVAQGHTVDDVNLVQRLFSPRPSARLSASQAALRLLGHRTAREFANAQGLGPVPEGPALNLALARALVEKGYLVDQEE